jgi:hypothetical protein
MKALHLIQNIPELRPKLIAPGSQIYESGFWWLPIKRAKSFIGENIFFYDNQLAESFFGGVIKDCWVENYNGQDRVVFKFEALASHKGKRPANPEGWNDENWVINFEE